MAKILIKNQTQYKLSVPVANVAVAPYGTREATVIDVDAFYNDPRIQGLRTPTTNNPNPSISVTLVQDSTPGAEGDAVLPFYATGDMPAAADSSGMMLYNTSYESVLYSDGADWFAPMTIPVFSGALPPAANYPEPFLIYEKTDSALYVNQGSSWLLSKSSGIQYRAYATFPNIAFVPDGTLIIDSDTDQLRMANGTDWLYPTYAKAYLTEASLPATTDVCTGNLAYVINEGSLRFQSGAEWLSTTGKLRYYENLVNLPTLSYGEDQRGVFAYVHEIQSIAYWNGKKWLYTSQARNFNAISRPLATAVPIGYMLFNTTSGKPNWSNGTNWVDGVGTIDP